MRAVVVEVGSPDFEWGEAPDRHLEPLEHLAFEFVVGDGGRPPGGDVYELVLVGDGLDLEELNARWPYHYRCDGATITEMIAVLTARMNAVEGETWNDLVRGLAEIGDWEFGPVSERTLAGLYPLRPSDPPRLLRWLRSLREPRRGGE